mmetsp:Transcript_24758/g.55768  ORF Transcript_24758/g.55768 Transcript_24758/m.55768 type:complete len:170 (+) Transcript_24758:145-654(+)|eukprot:CAMPEP_0172604274 /NCGR_PEP_ID=MMETSP1068-20121228/24526_1 /TAXON_ID=35684 /ORGANISM="Pseudopedinella elastica, Strain CCMP716" /LENGTH=169 /DNA_ID=CAMNT_0013406281 /DNA_START=99 /DNA_END=608 /DNA_ORIENTATION=-
MSNNVRYRRVSPNGNGGDANGEEAKKRRAELVERISSKVQALFWVAGSIAAIYFTDLIRVLFEDKRINRLFLNVAIVCLAVNTVIMIYLTAWVPYQERLLSRKLGKPKKLDWEVYCPRMIPTMTAFALVFFIAMTKAMWPVFGFLTPLILLLLFMGFVFTTHFIPYFGG